MHITGIFTTVERVLSNLLAIFFALASALTVAWGTVIRHRIALDADDSVMRAAMSNPLWWVGTAAAIGAYGLQVIALGFGTLLVVQPILVLSLMFTLPLSAWYSGRKMPFHEVFWSIALTIAVGIMVIYGRPVAGNPAPNGATGGRRSSWGWPPSQSSAQQPQSYQISAPWHWARPAALSMASSPCSRRLWWIFSPTKASPHY